MTSRRRSTWQFFKVCVKRTSNGEPRGYIRMRFCIDVVILTRFSVWNLRSCWLCPIASTQAV
ncbi:hypothetical protein Goshw_015109 [Gossypium schwendimanii]|uniref:Uncharacterized protein n=1 Tax=Gossypium schwendimanii TaxID=34291 RepID=A0A7J9N8N3_GOSSC|nr:hypothetical protein [Gossypium schwendimanii]